MNTVSTLLAAAMTFQDVYMPPSLVPDDMDADWYQCGIKLLHKSGKTGSASQYLPDLYRQHAVDKSPEFLKLMMVVMYIESNFQKRALSTAGAHGLMQMTSIAAREAEIQCGLRRLNSLEELYDSATNVRYGSCYLKFLLDLTEGDIIRTAILYNGGTRQLMKKEAGEPMAEETTMYVSKIKRTYSMCN